MDDERFAGEWSLPLGIAADAAVAIVHAAARSAPPLRSDNLNLVVCLCGVTGRGSRKLGLTKKVDAWYAELQSKDIGSPWVNLQRSDYERMRTAFNFYACLCYAELATSRPAGREALRTVFWSVLRSRTARKTWGLPDESAMNAYLSNYPAIDAEDLVRTVAWAGIRFASELGGPHDQGSDGDRLSIVTWAIGQFTGQLTGSLGAFGKSSD